MVLVMVYKWRRALESDTVCSTPSHCIGYFSISNNKEQMVLKPKSLG